MRPSPFLRQARGKLCASTPQSTRAGSTLPAERGGQRLNHRPTLAATTGCELALDRRDVVPALALDEPAMGIEPGPRGAARHDHRDRLLALPRRARCAARRPPRARRPRARAPDASVGRDESRAPRRSPAPSARRSRPRSPAPGRPATPCAGSPPALRRDRGRKEAGPRPGACPRGARAAPDPRSGGTAAARRAGPESQASALGVAVCVRH
jgi:hypothetical protein